MKTIAWGSHPLNALPRGMAEPTKAEVSAGHSLAARFWSRGAGALPSKKMLEKVWAELAQRWHNHFPPDVLFEDGRITLNGVTVTAAMLDAFAQVVRACARATGHAAAVVVEQAGWKHTLCFTPAYGRPVCFTPASGTAGA